MQTDLHAQWLTELAGLPTAAGREGHVIKWIEAFAAERSDVAIKRDAYGNMLIGSTRMAGSTSPVVITAHMDHPAFVVVKQTGDSALLADFRGGVHDEYFEKSPVLLHTQSGEAIAGRVTELIIPEDIEADKQAVIAFDQKIDAKAGQIITWDTGEPRIDEGMFYARACDDLAGLAAGLGAFDTLRLGNKNGSADLNVQLLLTRSEEIGFIGAIGACQSGLIAEDAWVINLECSKSHPTDSPIGSGPIVRVGDRTSTFHPELMYRISQIARECATTNEKFRFQRKLMPGGTCEASAFLAFGYKAGCICLPLGRYHNMNEDTKRIDAEQISLADFRHLVELLVAAAPAIQNVEGPNLRDRLDKLFDRRRNVVESSAD